MSSGRHTLVAKRYAKALFGVCQPADFDKTSAQLKALAAVWQQSRDLRESMLNPRVNDALRVSTIDAVVQALGGWSTDPLRRTVHMLVSLRKAAVLPELSESFDRFVAEYRKSLSLEVTLATAATESVVEDLKSRLSKALGGEVSLQVKSDPTLLGGLTVRLGDRLLDRSVAGSLQRMAIDLTR